MAISSFFGNSGKYIDDLSLVGSVEGPKHEYWTAGCVLAARLTEDPSLSVLVLEAGGSGTPHLYEFTLEPQVHATNRPRYFPRGKVLGGCSSVNAQMAQYGAPSDFDQWAALNNDESWSWKNLHRYFKKFEKYTDDPAYPNVDSSVRGSEGPVRVGYFNRASEHSKAFVEACGEVGIPPVPDFNGPKGPLGAGRVMTYIDSKGQRVSSETAYLTKEVLARPNLKVAIHAQVTRIIFDRVNGVMRAIGVECANSPDGPRYKAHARREVIISAGTIHSPHILMLSGIGPATELRKHGIPVIRDLPGVGANLVDHPIASLYLRDKKNDSVNILKPKNVLEGLQLAREVAKYQLYGTGKLATNFGEAAAFVRTDNPVLFPPKDYPQKLEDSTSGAASPDLELFCTPMAFKDHGQLLFNVHTYSLHCYLVRPTSRGTVRLTSASPWALPSVNPNYLHSPHDLDKLLRGFRLILKIAHAKAMESYIDHSDTNPELDHAKHLDRKTDDELKEMIRERVETVYHPTSTCRMAPEGEAEGGVVDSRLKVYGIEGLRVCDASVFPWIVSGHTAGACFAIAEKFADDLKAEFKASKI
ncbi:hypothetical protein R3P38DRAFT_3313389 [Favolaschia claudopus]|uniref:Glucose-methanol-choline oxidoreductase N-terminal domain-containing protein n=1 Tax=Favolaschia claudopus TaxID=2862362 RepID=A0AAW0C1Z7_9AGAR